MKKITIIIALLTLSSCKYYRTCKCETPPGVTPYEYATEGLYETPNKAEQMCYDLEEGKEWECELL